MLRWSEEEEEEEQEEEVDEEHVVFRKIVWYLVSLAFGIAVLWYLMRPLFP